MFFQHSVIGRSLQLTLHAARKTIELACVLSKAADRDHWLAPDVDAAADSMVHGAGGAHLSGFIMLSCLPSPKPHMSILGVRV
jgi:hypothetical protein